MPSDSSSRGPGLQFSFSHSSKAQPKRIDEGEPVLRLLVLGAFATEGPDPNYPISIDADSLQARMAVLEPSLSILGCNYRLRALEDFSPDRLIEKHETLKTWWSWREDLRKNGDQARSRTTIMELLGSAEPPPGKALEVDPLPTHDSPDPLDEDPFAALMGGTTEVRPSPPATGGRASRIVDELVRKALGHHARPDPSAASTALLAQFDEFMAAVLREILHLPAWQKLESLWLALDRLVEEMDPDDPVEIEFIAVSGFSLRSGLAQAEGPDNTLWTHLVDKPEEHRHLWLVAESFAATQEEAVALATLAKWARKAGVTAVVDAQPEWAGINAFRGTLSPSDLAATQPNPLASLRETPNASHLALALPRVLGRLPYGVASETINAFAFEEFKPAPEHEHFLWTSPALVCGTIWAQHHAIEPEEFAWSDPHRLGGLPVFTHDGRQQPIAEAILTETALAHLGRLGLMPIASIKNSDNVIIPPLVTVQQNHV